MKKNAFVLQFAGKVIHFPMDNVLHTPVKWCAAGICNTDIAWYQK